MFLTEKAVSAYADEFNLILSDKSISTEVENAKSILAHARIQDFDVDGKKMLFIEEIQSDWNNDGHKKGYSPNIQDDRVIFFIYKALWVC